MFCQLSIAVNLQAEGGADMEGSIKAREQLLLPVYRQVAVSFAQMHDSPVRMVAKGVVRGVLPWQQARPFLAHRLCRRWGACFWFICTCLLLTVFWLQPATPSLHTASADHQFLALGCSFLLLNYLMPLVPATP